MCVKERDERDKEGETKPVALWSTFPRRSGDGDLELWFPVVFFQEDTKGPLIILSSGSHFEDGDPLCITALQL